MSRHPDEIVNVLVDALETTRGNIQSLGPAGALKGASMLWSEWLIVVENALRKAECQQNHL